MKLITHLMDKAFKNVCGNNRKNTDGTHKKSLVTCKKCKRFKAYKVG